MAIVQQRRVLVTRPALQADALLDALQAAQWQPLALPMLDIVPRSDPATQALLAQALQPPQPIASRPGRGGIAIFVSTNAVSCTSLLLDAGGLQWPQALACIAIGPATQAAIAQRGWPQFDEFKAGACQSASASDTENDSINSNSNTQANAYSSAELLALLRSVPMQGRAVTVFSGVGGRREIDTELLRRGARLSRVETYQRTRPAYSEAEFSARMTSFMDGASAGSAQAMLFASGETLENFLWYAQRSAWLERLRAVAAIVPSERIAALGRQAGLQRMVVAGNASQQAFLHALQSL